MKKILSMPALVAAVLMAGCQAPRPEQPTSNINTPQTEAPVARIAFVNTDSLLSGYEYAKKVSEELTNKAELAQADFQEKARIFQQDYAAFQRKVQTNAFTSQESYQRQGTNLQKKEQELQELNQKLTADLMNEQNRLTAELHDTITKFLNEYAVGRYSLILSNNMGDNVLYSAPGIDITAEVVGELNKRYASKNK